MSIQHPSNYFMLQVTPLLLISGLLGVCLLKWWERGTSVWEQQRIVLNCSHIQVCQLVYIVACFSLINLCFIFHLSSVLDIVLSNTLSFFASRVLGVPNDQICPGLLALHQLFVYKLMNVSRLILERDNNINTKI